MTDDCDYCYRPVDSKNNEDYFVHDTCVAEWRRREAAGLCVCCGKHAWTVESCYCCDDCSKDDTDWSGYPGP